MSRIVNIVCAHCGKTFNIWDDDVANWYDDWVVWDEGEEKPLLKAKVQHCVPECEGTNVVIFSIQVRAVQQY